jgi:cytochrome c oxidase cbb3-type subunit 3
MTALRNNELAAKNLKKTRRLLFASLLSFFVLLGTVRGQTPKPKVDAGGPVAPTAALERGRTVYVLNACHFCHGIDLTGASMGAADLMHSPLVGADRNGNLIGSIVLAGLPNLQTAMPKFVDLTKEQISDLAGYIHYLRQQGRYTELMAADSAPGDPKAGEQYFNGAGGCSKCHSASGDLARAAHKYDAATLRSRFLRPGPAISADNITPIAGDQAHLRLLEIYSPADVQNVLAYLNQLP